MALKLNIGLSRKVGEANHGSRGVSVNLELELESGLVESPNRLQERVRQLFRLAKSSVEEELGVGSPPSGANGHKNGPQGGSRAGLATKSQVRGLCAIAKRQGLNLEQMVHGQFGSSRPAYLTTGQAGQLIDNLNAGGTGDRDE